MTTGELSPQTMISNFICLTRYL